MTLRELWHRIVPKPKPVATETDAEREQRIRERAQEALPYVHMLRQAAIDANAARDDAEKRLLALRSTVHDLASDRDRQLDRVKRLEEELRRARANVKRLKSKGNP